MLGVISDTDRRGAQTFGFELGRHLADHGVDGRTVAVEPGATGGLDVEVLGPNRWSLAGLRRLRHLMRQADVTVAHGSSALPACVLAGLGARCPIVYRQISDPVYWAPAGPRRWRVRLYYRFVDHVVTLSPRTGAVLTELFGVAPAKLTVIPNAVPADRFSPATDQHRSAARRALAVDPERPVVAYVGAVTQEKGIEDLLRAADPSWQLVVAGEGPFRAAAGRLAEELGVSAALLGAVSQTEVVYHAADVVVLPSWSEQHPAVLLEAALAGVPVVATRVGTVDELVEDGRTGLLVEPHRPTELRRAVERVLADEPARSAMTGAARSRVLEGFTLEVVAARWAGVVTAQARS